MPDQAKPVSRPWRRLLRFSVRGLIVLVLVIGCWLGWLARSARVQREALDSVGEADIDADFGWEFSFGASSREELWAPEWLVERIGIDCFGHVASLVFFGKADADLAHVGRLDQLERLHLNQSLH